ncbi:GNAT family N-acetyltransferase, partial [Klebsiella pneumoniae]
AWFSAAHPCRCRRRAGRIRHLYISERYRRRGIGQQLLVSVITHSSAWFDFLNTHAPAQAWPFYERLGFRPVYDEPRVTHRLFCSL